ncbi:MAG: D-alanine-D-alanine ligase [Myxococcota bacterium]|jgi:D-alanine-D-alanine ligase
MRIAFTFNLKESDEEEQAEFDSAETIAALSELLVGLGHEVHLVNVTGSISRLVARLETLRPDLVFNTAEGTHGRFREAFYPALFEQLRLPYTGSGPYVCGITLDKQATKLMVRLAGVPTPNWGFFSADQPERPDVGALTYPVIVKPNFEGSSKGVTRDSLVESPAQLTRVLDDILGRYGAGVLVEEFIVGQDVTVPYIEGVGVLTPASYRLDVDGVSAGYEIYDYSLKNDHPERVHVSAPADLPPEVMEKLKAHTAVVMKHLDIRDMGRADYRVTDDGRIYFIEVNALPSLEPGASIYEAARLHGLGSDGEVLNAILQSALTRQHVVVKAPRKGGLRVGFSYNVKRVDPKSGDDADAEFDSPETIEAVSKAISALGHEVIALEATPQLPRLIGDLDIDVVFNIAEGLRGRSREAQVPALLEILGIPYTGSDPAALAITLDKALAKRIVTTAGVATPHWVLLGKDAVIPTNLTFPVIVKPNAEGSSKGISRSAVARDQAELEAAVASARSRFSSNLLVEEFLVGREFTVGILGDVQLTTLPIMEIAFDAPEDALPIYSYEHKIETEGGVSYQVPANIDAELAERIRQVALTSFEALGCRDVGRVDVRLNGAGEPNFIECNPLPGLSPGFSDLCVAAAAADMSHGALIARILSPAVRRLMLENA